MANGAKRTNFVISTTVRSGINVCNRFNKVYITLSGINVILNVNLTGLWWCTVDN